MRSHGRLGWGRPAFAGSSYGSMGQFDTGAVITISLINTDVPVNGMTAGILKDMSFSSSQNLIIEKGGDYLVNWSLSFSMAAGSNQEVEGSVFINAVKQNLTSAHRKITTATDKGNMAAGGIIKCLQDDVVNLQVLNETSTNDIVVDHATFSLTKVGNL